MSLNDTKKDHLDPNQRVSVSATTLQDEVLKADPDTSLPDVAYRFTNRTFAQPKNPYE